MIAATATLLATLPAEAQEAAAEVPHHIGPMLAGAECWRCPLKGCGRGPVPAQMPAEGWVPFLIVGEAPGQSEVDVGAPFQGASGRETREALRRAGVDADQVSFTNAVSCMPEGMDMDRLLRQCKKDGTATPIECCAPRLKNELSRTRYAVLMGGPSLKATGVDTSGKIMKHRGKPVQIEGGPPALPVPHAAFVLRESGRVYRQVFRHDMAKAVRIATHGTSWVDPSFFVIGHHGQLENFLSQRKQHWALDTETNGKDPWTCGLRRIGVGDDKEVAIYSPLSVTGAFMMPDYEIQSCTRVFNDFFQRAPQLDFHNYWGFDSVVLAQHGFQVPDNRVYDSLIAHSIGYTSELPHKLDFLASIYTDAPHWKEDVKHTNIDRDDALDKYLSYDIATTHACAPFVSSMLDQTHQRHIYDLDMRLSKIGRAMSRLGVKLDRQVQWRFASEYETRARRLLREFHEACGRDVNPRSPQQVRTFLYEDLKLPILEDYRTATDEPSTAEPAILELLAMGVSPRTDRVLKALLGYREADKLLGTFIGRLVEQDNMWSLEGGPPVHVDGRVRTTWKTGRATGRWSSGDPINLQNQPKKLRAMYVPEDGNVFVGADYSAVEMRLTALLANDRKLIEAFAAFDAGTGPDLHKVNACTAFGCDIADVTDEVRTFAKRFVYGLTYGAEPEKIHQTLSLLRDDDLNPVFPGITLAEVERVYKKWWDAHPDIAAWRKGLIRAFRRQGFIATEWHQRKRFFLGGEQPTEIFNFPIQGAAADIQNGAIEALVNAYPFNFERRCGVIIQAHDQLVVECPANDAERAGRILSWAMERKVGDMAFPAEVKIGKSWKVV